MDIDSDFSPEVRGKVLDYVKNKYGEEAVCCIATIGTQKPKNAIRNCARLLGDRKYGNPKELLNLASEMCALVPDKADAKFVDCEYTIREKFHNNEDAMEVLEDALIVEGTFTQVGMHAAGVIIADNGDVGEYIPLMKSKDGQWVSQCDKDYTESRGLLKMDFLGLRNLGIITDTLRAIQKKYGKSIEMNRVSLDEPEVYANIFANANTNSVFQFESEGMKKILRDMKPNCIEDLILLNAAYRPGPLQYLGEISATKNSGKKPNYIIPEMEEVLGVTYGKPIYQEQVQSIFNKFAGFTLGEADIIRRYMSKKKKNKFMAYHDKFINGMVDHGADPVAAEEFWTELVNFSEYAFNKSHSCAYAITAYYTGWLKYHYPQEYLTSVANLTEFDKVGAIMSDIRNAGIVIHGPDVNLSGVYFDSLDGVRYGLSNIKDVASAAIDIIAERNANGMFGSFEDFLTRTNVRKNVTIALIHAGAFDAIGVGFGDSYWQRRAEMLKLVDEKEENLPTTRNEALANELKYTAMYITENPAAGYTAPNKISDISGMTGKSVELVGVITDYAVKTSKKGDTYASFTLVDSDYNSIPVVCFAKEYEKYRDTLTANVCRIKGNVRLNNDHIQLTLTEAYSAVPIVKGITLTPEKDKPFKMYFALYDKYKDNAGVPLYFNLNGKPRQTSTIRVNPKIMDDPDLQNVLSAIL